MMRGVLCVGAAFLGSMAADALAQQPQAPIYGHHMWDGAWHGWFLGPLFMIGFLVLAAMMVLLLVRWLGGGPGHSAHSGRRDTSIDILKERFAKGEIDKEEFEERRRILEDLR